MGPGKRGNSGGVGSPRGQPKVWHSRREPSKLLQSQSDGGIAKWLRRRSAKPLFPGSNPGAASTSSDGSRRRFPSLDNGLQRAYRWGIITPDLARRLSLAERKRSRSVPRATTAHLISRALSARQEASGARAALRGLSGLHPLRGGHSGRSCALPGSSRPPLRVPLERGNGMSRNSHSHSRL